MSAFHTLHSAAEPRVLLVGAPPWLVSLVSTLYSDHEIRVVPLSEEAFLRIEMTSIDATSVYKILWWVNFPQDQGEALLEAFQALADIPLVVLGSLPEQLVFEQEPPSKELQESQDFFAKMVRALPQAQFFFARDMVSSESLQEPLAFSWRGLRQGMLFDPELKWFLLSHGSFFELIAPALVRPPTSRRVVIRGRAILSSNSIKKSADLSVRYYDLALEIIPVLGKRLSPSLPGFVEAVVSGDTESLLDEFIRRKDQWEREIPVVVTPASRRSKQKTVAPVVKKTTPVSTLLSGQKRARMNEGKRLINQSKNRISPPENQEEKIEGELTRIFQEKRTEQKEKRIDNKVAIVKKIARKSKKNKALFVGGMVALALGGVVLALWLLLSTSIFFAKREVQAFFQTPNALSQTYSPGPWARVTRFQADTYIRLLGDGWAGEGNDLAEFEKALLQFQEEKTQAERLATQYVLGVLGRGETSATFPAPLSEKLTALSESQARVLETGERIQFSDEALNTKKNEWLEQLQSSQQGAPLSAELPPFLNEILGGNGKRVYAVLLQNNLELRPTGGFIQAVGLLVFDKGLLTDSQVISTYELDDRRLGAISAPAELRQYLGEDAWYLRDSNWNPDYALSAERAAWFIREATGVQVDGVWALNYRAVQNMLEAIGPMEFPAFSEVLTSGNLLERVEFHSDEEVSRAPDKPAYAIAVFSQLLRLFQEFPAEKTPLFLQSLEAGLKEKQIFLYFDQDEIQETNQRLGWSGVVIQPTCPSQFSQENCLVDQVFEVEANVGLNRVSEYIRRNVTHRVDLSGSKVGHTRVVSLENTARSNGWPLGVYKTYLRFLLNGNAEVTSVLVNGRQLAGEDLMLYREEGRRVVGVPAEVPPQGKATIEVRYTTHAIPDGSFSFLLFDQQQSGIGETPTEITLYNPRQKPALIAPQAELFGDSIEFSLSKADHLFVGASYLAR